MNVFFTEASIWLWDYYLLATALLAVILLTTRVIAQPARRMAIHWATTVGLLLLALLCALPGWSILHMTSAPPPEPVVQAEQFEPVTMPAIEFAPGPQSFEPPLPIVEEIPAEEFVAEVTFADRLGAIDFGTLAAYAIGAGTFATLLWLTVGAWQVRRLRRQAASAPAQINDLLVELAQQTSIKPDVGLSDRLSVAVAVGLRSPMILLPGSLAEHSGPYELRTVLAHELAHIRNRDLWLLALVRSLLPLLWVHPLYWLWRRGLRLDQETLADALASEQTSQADYADQLVTWAKTAAGIQPPRFASSVGLWESPSQLKRRIAILLDEKLTVLRACSRRWRFGSVLTLLALALGLSLITWQPESTIAAKPADAESADKPSPVRLLKKLNSGASVELLAIGTNARNEKTNWWDAKGTPQGELPFEVLTSTNIEPLPNRQLVFRVHDLPAGAGVRWKTEPASNASSGTIVVDGVKKPHGYYSHEFERPRGGKTFTLRVGVAAGDWVTMASGRSGATSNPLQNTVFSEALSDKDGNAVVIISHSLRDADTRGLAIDVEGKEWISTSRRGSSAGKQNQSQWTFVGLKPEQVKKFGLQVRQYEWVEFDTLPAEALAESDSRDASRLPDQTNRDEADSSEHTAAIQELVDSLAEVYEKIHALHKVGAAGGETHKLLLAEYHLQSARAKLLHQKGELDEARRQFQVALVVAEKYLPAVEAEYDSGRVTLKALLESKQILLEAKRNLAGASDALGRARQDSSRINALKWLRIAEDEGFFKRRGPAGTGLEQRIPAGLVIHTAYQFDPNNVLDQIRPLFDRRAGYEGAFEGVLKGFEKDPYGPRLKVRPAFIDHLAGEVSLVTNAAADQLWDPPEWLVGIKATNAKALAATLDRFMQVETDVILWRLGTRRIWQLESKGSDVRFVCVEFGHLLCANDLVLLSQLLDGKANPILRDAQSTSRPNTGATLGPQYDLDRATTPADANERTAKTPELVYLGWQTEQADAEGDPPKIPMWDMNGRALSDTEVATLSDQLGDTRLHYPREGGLPTLLLVFRVDGEVSQHVMATLLGADGTRHSQTFARTRVTAGMNVATLQPLTSALAAWPGTIDLEIKYPIENTEVFKRLSEVADSPVRLAEGVSWYLDPNRAIERDAQNQRQRARDKTAAVLQLKREPPGPYTQYAARVYLQGAERPLRENYVTMIEPEGQLHTIRVSEAFDSKQDVERVEFTRRRFDIAKIRGVPVRVDLIPSATLTNAKESNPTSQRQNTFAAATVPDESDDESINSLDPRRGPTVPADTQNKELVTAPSEDALNTALNVGKIQMPLYKQLESQRQPNAFVGICVDERGQPLADVPVQLYSQQIGIVERQKPTLVASTTSNASGIFMFPNVVDIEKQFPQGIPNAETPRQQQQLLTIVGRKTGRVPGHSSEMAAGIAARGNISVWVMRKAQTLNGRITDVDGNPVAGAVVKFGHAMMFNGLNELRLGTSVTDADGRYSIRDLPAYDVAEQQRQLDAMIKRNPALTRTMATGVPQQQLLVTHPKFTAKRVAVRRVPGEVNAKLSPGSAIEGKLSFPTEARPNSLNGGVVYLQRDMPEPKPGDPPLPQSFQVQSTKLDGEGKYRFESLPASTYHLTASVPNWVSSGIENVVTAIGKTTAAPDIPMTRGGRVRVQLLDGDTGDPQTFDKPMPGWVTPQRVPRDKVFRYATNVVTFSRQGTAEVQLAPGSYQLNLSVPSASGKGSWIPREFAGLRSEGGPVKIPTIEVQEGQTVAHQVKTMRWNPQSLDVVNRMQATTKDGDVIEIEEVEGEEAPMVSMPVQQTVPSDADSETDAAQTNEPAGDTSSYFYAVPVTTALQKSRLGGDKVVAYLDVNATKLVSADGKSIDFQSKLFVPIQARLRALAEAMPTGTLRVSLDMSGTPQSGSANFAKPMREVFSKLGVDAGFKKVFATETWHNEPDHQWRPFQEANNEGNVKEPIVAVNRVQIAPVHNAFTKRLVRGADCVVSLIDRRPIDVDSLLPAKDLPDLKAAIEKLELAEPKAVLVQALFLEPEQGGSFEYYKTLPQFQEDSKFHLDAAKVLFDLGFNEVRLHLQPGSTGMIFRYRSDELKADAGRGESDEDDKEVDSLPTQQTVPSDVNSDATDPASPDPITILAEATEDARRGRYEDALAKRVWYHNKVLSIRPSQSKARLSVALSQWLDLGKAYPPALAKMREIRDALEKKIRDPNAAKVRFTDFQEFAALNDTLGEQERTVQLFRWLDVTKPRDAWRVFGLAGRYLNDEKALELLLKYQDTGGRVALYYHSYRLLRQSAVGSKQQSRLLRLADDKLVRDVTTLVESWIERQRQDQAIQSAQQAMELLQDDKRLLGRLESQLKPLLKEDMPAVSESESGTDNNAARDNESLIKELSKFLDPPPEYPTYEEPKQWEIVPAPGWDVDPAGNLRKKPGRVTVDLANPN